MNPMLAEDLFVGRTGLRDEIASYLHAGRSVALVGGRRAGKSTVARNILERAVGRPIIRTSVDSWEPASAESAWGSLLTRIQGRLQVGRSSATSHEVEAALRAVGPVTLIIDEADKLLLRPWGSDLLSYLRYLDDDGLRFGVSFLLIGGPILLLFGGPEPGSPPLNTSEPQFIEPLPRSAVEELAAMVAAARTTELADWAMHIAGGHAYLTTRLFERIWRGEDQTTATAKVRAKAVTHFERWRRQLGKDGCELVQTLPADGMPTVEFQRPELAKLVDTAHLALSVGAVRIDDGRLVAGPEMFTEWLRWQRQLQTTFVYDLAISYASPDIDIARTIANQLRNEFNVFFAPDRQALTLGHDLNGLLPQTYGIDSRYVLIVSTPSYVKSHWALVEYESVARSNPDRLLILEKGAVPPDLPDSIVYYRGSDDSELIRLIDDLRIRLRH